VISERIKAALKVNQLAKEGKKLGNPNSLKALANAAKRRAAPRAEVLTLMRNGRQEKKSFWTIRRRTESAWD
jgi:hypothetical protein